MKQEIIKTTYLAEAAARLGMINARDQQRQQQGLFIELYYQLHQERLRVDFDLNNDRLLHCMKELLEENVEDLVEIISKETNAEDGQSLSDSEEAYDPAKDEDPGIARLKKKKKQQLNAPLLQNRCRPPRRGQHHHQDHQDLQTLTPRRRNPLPLLPGRPQHRHSFNGNDLRRHFKVHVAKRELSEEAVEKLLTVVRAGQIQRGKTQARKGKAPLKGKLKKWCPVPGCDQIVLDVGRHLRNKKLHDLAKDSREYQRLVRMAKHYKGLDELEDNVIPPPPAIVEEEKRKLAEKEDPQPNPNPSDAANPASDAENPASDAANPAGDAEDPASDAASQEEEEEEESDEDNDYSSTAHPKWIDYFTAAKPQNNRHRWLVNFFDFLTRPTAGDKKQTILLQHANQMRNLLEAVDPAGDDILCLLDHQGDAVWKMWVKPNLDAKTKKPGTIISYLTSYEKFLSFVNNFEIIIID
ncbi:hypothetical protein OS493_001351 [Desmophyllum pertusum]|uniref:Uncharacterized protein n=1 Tax=Desmophyllum pertusum TaxID=174260 RepID=A0A9W9ZH49_9CNID|nr:hypothetical protein OS493_001351 [Desmophyllum pertusum]